ncbi:MAG: riboflavin synthase [Actinomycetota bacterium]|jgi:riboflavin synthase|nr:riboflavin synthase [Actinomycetota bacterium]
MFTGLVEEVGRVEAAEDTRLRIAAHKVLDDVEVGGSIAVDGCCLTVVAHGEGWWEADLSDETVSRTTLGALAPGDRVSLERPLRLADRLGGHLVQGHVDGVGEVTAPAPDLGVRLPAGLGRYVVEKGSIAVDGVSLTVVAVDDESFTVSIIPHTYEVTALAAKQPGDKVNLEVDLMAKYVERMVVSP